MRTLASFAPLMILTAILSFLTVCCTVKNLLFPDSLTLLWGWSFGFFIAVWIMLDARRRRCVPCYDFGFLVALFLPVSLIWYAFWTRGWRGFALLGVFVGLMYLPWVSSLIAWLVLRARA